MTATYRLFAMDDRWLAHTPNPTWEDVTDGVMFDELDLEQCLIEWVFVHRSDALQYLTNGEFGPPGGYEEWDGRDCFMGFVSALATAEIARLLAEKTPEELLREATWIDAEFHERISRCLKIYYPELRRFIEEAVAQGRGLACFFLD
ncbi:hypothetical protein [Microvirga roseola]|uniref:hypothetical protein n=1 Tax=Microvirga roseola TaxID=2883126 RepID=UPI001E361D4F|nr:hypothetical protein [Microvirga roseola]